MEKFFKNIATIIIIFFVISGILVLYQDTGTRPEEVSLSALVGEINEGQVKKIDVKSNELSIELLDGKQQIAQKEPEASLTETLKNYGVDTAKLNAVSVEIKKES